MTQKEKENLLKNECREDFNNTKLDKNDVMAKCFNVFIYENEFANLLMYYYSSEFTFTHILNTARFIFTFLIELKEGQK